MYSTYDDRLSTNNRFYEDNDVVASISSAPAFFTTPLLRENEENEENEETKEPEPFPFFTNIDSDKPGSFFILKYKNNCICGEYKVARIIEKNCTIFKKKIENNMKLFIEIQFTDGSVILPKTFYIHLRNYIKQHTVFSKKRIDIQHNNITIYNRESDYILFSIVSVFMEKNSIPNRIQSFFNLL
jgi:hypothetical protein